MSEYRDCPHITIHTEITHAECTVKSPEGVEYLPDVIVSFCADCGIKIKEIVIVKKEK